MWNLIDCGGGIWEYALQGKLDFSSFYIYTHLSQVVVDNVLTFFKPNSEFWSGAGGQAHTAFSFIHVTKGLKSLQLPHIRMPVYTVNAEIFR